MTQARNVLVSDFDGTVTAEDFYLLAVRRLLKPEDLGYWEQYREGAITHFTALQRIFARIRAPEQDVRALVRDMRPDPLFPQELAALRANGWDVVVASAGCRWYIDIVLGDLGVTDLEVHANPGRYRAGGPLVMEEPAGQPFHCRENGVDKAGIVRFHQERGARVAYAGDGHTDLPAALMVPPELRFARGDLALALTARAESFMPFTRWSEVSRALLESTP